MNSMQNLPVEKNDLPAIVNPEYLILKAIEQNIPVETMERLLAMRRELREEQALREYNDAMSIFQSKCPVIKKEAEGGKTNSGVVAYYYAPLDSIVSQVKDLIKKCGFSYSFESETLESGIKVTCIINHIGGHSKRNSIEVPLGKGTSVMSAPQVSMSSMTFSKRYAFCNGFGIMTGDEDDDAKVTVKNQENKKQNSGKQKIEEKPKSTQTEEQQTQILFCLNANAQAGDKSAKEMLEKGTWTALKNIEGFVNTNRLILSDIIKEAWGKDESKKQIIENFLASAKVKTIADLKFMGLVKLYNFLAHIDALPEIVIGNQKEEKAQPQVDQTK